MEITNEIRIALAKMNANMRSIDIARMCGASQTAVCRWINGKTNSIDNKYWVKIENEVKKYLPEGYSIPTSSRIRIRAPRIIVDGHEITMSSQKRFPYDTDQQTDDVISKSMCKVLLDVLDVGRVVPEYSMFTPEQKVASLETAMRNARNIVSIRLGNN